MKQIVVYEVHNGTPDVEFELGEEYIIPDVKIVGISDIHVFDKQDNRMYLKFTLECNKDLSIMDFITEMSSEFSNAFITIAPDNSQSIIMDFTLPVDRYFDMIDKG